MKLYEIENFISKKLRRKMWPSDDYIYYRTARLYSPTGLPYSPLDYWSIFEANDWEEYVEPKRKQKKKYTMYRHWYLVVNSLSWADTTMTWGEFMADGLDRTYLETEILKEFEVEE